MIPGAPDEAIAFPLPMIMAGGRGSPSGQDVSPGLVGRLRQTLAG